MNIFALWGEIEINRKQAEQDIKSVEDQAEKSGQKMESSFNKVTQAVNALLGKVGDLGQKIVAVGKSTMKKAGVPLAALTALMGGLAKKTADYGDQMAKSAQEVGMNAEAYQELTYVLGQNNLGAEESLRVFGRLNQRIGLARKGNENYRKSLEQMGVSMDALDKGLIGTEEAFEHIIEYLSGMEDSQLQAAYASDIFGTMLSRKMMPLIRSGSAGVAELRDRARELGIVLDEEFAERSEVFGDTMDDLKQTASGLTRAFGKELLAPLINIGRVITDVIAGMSRWVSENPKLVRQIIVWGGAIAGVLGVLVTLGTTLVITGKIIGALGAVFNILTSKPLLIIAAIGALYLAWESDWLGIRTAVEDAWAIISPVIDAIIEWGHQTISTVWNWTAKTVSAFLSWVQETAWPWIDGTVSTAWNWTTGTISAFVTWVKESAWPFLNGVATTTWSWTTGVVSTFVTWIKDVAWPFIGGTVSTAWNWTTGKVDSAFISWIYETAWPWINGTVTTTWDWTRGKVDSFILWIKDTAWPWINGTVSTVWDWTVKGLDWLRKLLGIGSGGEAEGPAAIEETSQAIDEAIGKAVTLQELLDAIYLAEGGPGARVPYGMTGFEGGVKYRSEIDQARFQELAAGLEVGSESYWRAVAQTTVEHYWRWFKTRFPELGEKTFDEVGPEIQSMFIAYLGSHFSPPEAHELNRNWVPNVLALVGFDELAQEFRAGNERVMDAWINAIYSKAGDVEAAVEWIAGLVARYMVGTSPPPEGPLSDIDEGGQRVMEAWVEGAEKGIKDGVPTLTTGLEKVKGLFNSIWDKVPEEIKGPIEQAMTWITDLIGQAEEALFKLDDLQDELERAITGGDSAGDQAEGFIAKLTAKLNEKLEELDDPLNRFVDTVSSAALHLGEVIRAISSGNWVSALLSIIMETESFAKAMELIGKVLAPVVALFDNVLRPIIEGLLKLWNGIIDALASISIFGWKPFAGLKSARIEWDDPDSGSGGSDRSSTGGRQISEITGPTRDLLVDLLSPLANFGAIVSPIQDIRNILYERMPNFNAFSLDFAGVGAGAIGPGVVIENITVHSSAKDGRQLARDMMDEIEREMARRINFGVRGRGGR